MLSRATYIGGSPFFVVRLATVQLTVRVCPSRLLARLARRLHLTREGSGLDLLSHLTRRQASIAVVVAAAFGGPEV